MTSTLREKLTLRLAEKGVTPSGLEVWLTCPKKAFYAQVLGLRPMQEVAEDGDRARFGEIVHRVLKEFLAPSLGKPIHGDMLDAHALTALLERALGEESFSLQMPYDARVALLAAGRERLARFVANLPVTTVAALEHPVMTTVALTSKQGRTSEVSNLNVSLHGRIDRVDAREDGHLVLDYKTGGIKSGGAEGWLDEALFTRMGECTPGTPEAAQLFLELADSSLDVQLPLYLHLLAADNAFHPSNAAWVELKKSGGEILLFSAKVEDSVRAEVTQKRVPALVRFVLEHLLAADALAARSGKHCQWCDFNGPCSA